MASPVFDKEQYELRGHLPTPMTEAQRIALNQALSRVNGQLDWNAQLLGFSGPNYWGQRIPTTDGSYQWKGLPETVAEKRAVQTGAFGVYNKDRAYGERPAPFNRASVGASADLAFDIFEEGGETRVVPYGQPRELLYETTPRLIVGGEYTFNALVDVESNTGTTEWLYVVQDLDQGITSVRLLGEGTDSEAVSVRIEGSAASPFLFFLTTWDDISDWTDQLVLDQFVGVWGNKGNAIASHFLFDALNVHGFNEEEALTLDGVLEDISVAELLGLVGLVTAPGTPLITNHYQFLVEGCDDLYQPTTSQETKIVRVQTEDYETLLTESGFEISEDNGPCAVLLPPGIVLETDGPEEPTTIVDNGLFEAMAAPVDALNNGEYPNTSFASVSDDGVFGAQPSELLTEGLDLIAINDPSYDNTACYLPPDAEFGECETPNYALTLRQFFGTEASGIAVDPGAGVSVPIGCNGVQYLFPPTCFIDNGEYEAYLGAFFLDGGDYDFPVVYTNSVGDGVYDRDPFITCDGLPEDYERIIDYDDLIIDVAGQPGPVLMTDPKTNDEIELAASGGDYDGFIIGFDGLEIDSISFEYQPKNMFGTTRFPCVEWVFDPTLDNSTYAPSAPEAAWMGTDDGEYDTSKQRLRLVSQSILPCGDEGGFLSFDDGVFDQIVVPNCDLERKPDLCDFADGGVYQLGVNPTIPANTVCGEECGTVDGGILGDPYEVYDEVVDAGAIDSCTIYDNTFFDLTPSGDGGGGGGGGGPTCIAYDNETYTPPLSKVDCVVTDKEVFNGGEPYTDPPIDDGIYVTTFTIEELVLQTESLLEISLESGNLLGVDPAILIPATGIENCTLCSTAPPEPVIIDCTLNNGDFDAAEPPAFFTNDGIYDRAPDPDCVPCQELDAPVLPCPIDPVRVRLDSLIFTALRWRMRPSVVNSKTPLRVWKNRVLNVADPAGENAYINQLAADYNSGPETPYAYRHFARLPAEYARNGKFWNRAQSALANESYFSRVLPTTQSQLPVIDEKPLLYDEVYSSPTLTAADDATFYVEDYLVSTITKVDTTLEDGFAGAEEVYEEPSASLPFIAAATDDYDAYSARLLNADGTRVGLYLKWGRKDRGLTGFLLVDVEDFALRYSVASEQPTISDASRTLIPNIEFPDDPDVASFSNYVVSYAYFVADMSAGDDPVFDPANWISHRSKIICKTEIEMEDLTTEDRLELLTEDFEPIATGSPSELFDVPLPTESRYIFHDDGVPRCADLAGAKVKI